MLLIISCHFCQYYDNQLAWWLNVGVQIFFILSGFLYGNKQIENPISWIFKQFSKILIPYYTFLLLALIAYGLICPEVIKPTNIASALFCMASIKGLGHLWFVGYILFCYLLTPYLFRLTEYYKDRSLCFHLFLFAAVFILFSAASVAYHSYFSPGRVLCYITGYFLSFFYHRYGRKALNVATYISVPCAVITNVAYIYMVLQLHIKEGLLFQQAVDYSHLFLGLAMTLVLMLLLRHIQMNSVLKWSDKYSYETYLVHQLFILSPLAFLPAIGNKTLGILTTTTVIFFSGYLLKKTDGWLKKLITSRQSV